MNQKSSLTTLPLLALLTACLHTTAAADVLGLLDIGNGSVSLKAQQEVGNVQLIAPEATTSSVAGARGYAVFYGDGQLQGWGLTDEALTQQYSQAVTGTVLTLRAGGNLEGNASTRDVVFMQKANGSNVDFLYYRSSTGGSFAQIGQNINNPRLLHSAFFGQADETKTTHFLNGYRNNNSVIGYNTSFSGSVLGSVSPVMVANEKLLLQRGNQRLSSNSLAAMAAGFDAATGDLQVVTKLPGSSGVTVAASTFLLPSQERALLAANLGSSNPATHLVSGKLFEESTFDQLLVIRDNGEFAIALPESSSTTLTLALDGTLGAGITQALVGKVIENSTTEQLILARGSSIEIWSFADALDTLTPQLITSFDGVTGLQHLALGDLSGTGYQQLIVVGNAVIPEPSVFVYSGLTLAGLLINRLRKRK